MLGAHLVAVLQALVPPSGRSPYRLAGHGAQVISSAYHVRRTSQEAKNSPQLLRPAGVVLDVI
jgi:hypothetical protein